MKRTMGASGCDQLLWIFGAVKMRGQVVVTILRVHSGGSEKLFIQRDDQAVYLHMAWGGENLAFKGCPSTGMLAHRWIAAMGNPTFLSMEPFS